MSAPVILAGKIARGAVGAISGCNAGNNCFATGGNGWNLPKSAALREDDGSAFLAALFGAQRAGFMSSGNLLASHLRRAPRASSPCTTTSRDVTMNLPKPLLVAI